MEKHEARSTRSERAPIVLAFAFVAIAGILILPHLCGAADPKFVPLADIGSNSSRLSGIYQSGDLSAFINGLFKFAIALGAIVAVLRIAYAGYLYMGSDLWSNKGKAKEILGDVTLGLVLLLSIYLILYQINPDIVKLDALKNIRPINMAQPNAPGGGAGNVFNDNGGN